MTRSRALAAALAALALAPALLNGLVNWDDAAAISTNPHLRPFTAENLRWMLTSFHLGHWQPLSWLSIAADLALWNGHPFGLHLTSLLLHAFNAGLVCACAEKLLRASGLDAARAGAAAFWAAALFAVHPLRVESVAWATERRDVLSGAFVLSAILVHCGEKRRPWLTALLTAAACASNVRMLFLPAGLLVLSIYPLRRPWTELLPSFVPAMAVTLVGIAAQAADPALVPLSSFGAGQRLAQAAFAPGFYLAKFLAPVGLSPLYERSPTFEPGQFVFYAAVFAAAAALAWAKPAGRAALAFYAVALFPTLGFVKTGRQTAADRYTYIALLAPALLAGVKLERRRALGGVLLAALTVMSWRQCGFWRDSVTLWERAVAMDPRSFFARRNLAAALAEAGRPEEAAAESARAEAAYSAVFGPR